MNKANLRIGIVCYPTYGGSGVVATELGLALAEKGHQVHFISYKRPARLSSYVPNVCFHEVSLMEYPLFDFKPIDTALASKIVDVVLFEKLDILHVHYAIPHATIGFLAREILKEKGIHLPYVTTLHGTDITLVGNDPSFFPVVEFSINQSNAVTAVSHSLRKQSLETFAIRKPISVIHNFIDLKRFKRIDELRNSFARSDEKILIHVSNFRKVKRVDDVLHIFYEVQKEIPSKLLLVGDGPERPRIEELSRDLGIHTSVKFLGKQDAIEELLPLADLFLLPSEHESFGLSALEAMASSVPVISSNIGGLTEVNIDGLTGFTCDVGDIVTMSGKAKYLLQDQKILNQFKKQAFEQAAHFEIHKILPLYEEVYFKLVNASS